MLPRRPFLFISLLATLMAAPLVSWAQITTLPPTAAAPASRPDAPARRFAAQIPGASSDLPLFALLGLGLLLTGAGMVSSIRPSRNRA
jgi:hypothetical protein